MADIFISYASDDRARVKPLAEALARKGWSVWWDRTIPAGKAFAEVIDQELSSARAVIVVWTSISIERNWVLEEAEDGRERGILVPVLMDDVKLPRGFRRIHAGDLIQWDGQESSPGFEKLIADLTAILGSPTGQGPETKETKPYAPKRATPADAAVQRGKGAAETTSARRRAIAPWFRSWQLVLLGAIVVLIGIYVPRSRSREASPVSTVQNAIEVNSGDKSEYVRIPAGVFQMGCAPLDDACDPDEKPPHPVHITKDFWIGRTEVTVKAYQKFVKDTSRGMPGGPDFDSKWELQDHPVISVAWDDAKAFCTWAGGRLPTEAEWEYAARGAGALLKYPWGNTASRENANYGAETCCSGLAEGKDAWKFTSPVGSFPGNSHGLHDMSGNVWEWVGDWYDKEYYQRPASADPQGPDSGQDRVLRGGAWYVSPEYLRSSDRLGGRPENRTNDIGFRCVRESPP